MKGAEWRNPLIARLLVGMKGNFGLMIYRLVNVFFYCNCLSRFIVYILIQGLTGKGTFINGERIESRVELKFGDFLSLGGPGPAKRQVTADEGVYFEYELSAENNARDMCTVFRFQVRQRL